eukprot:CAMPEP_0175990688 /NCGR_PEP_ID=MMETSP0108-20121206/52437_1 /TAXON_ID=195067 ORGANISM="Goniomonas pacifica, Strain CCMP1869" /NCGR_SAMPLE_ID=MMETSP0108 /ASSEMBLY_ACC=CAM_ASM_000204 /LENGTH=167 /DNA_ID=CAMNT_0017322171 /DNA_START=110 /DNA_END=613 /DNA_ORIENTATION=-
MTALCASSNTVIVATMDELQEWHVDSQGTVLHCCIEHEALPGSNIALAITQGPRFLLLAALVSDPGPHPHIQLFQLPGLTRVGGIDAPQATAIHLTPSCVIVGQRDGRVAVHHSRLGWKMERVLWQGALQQHSTSRLSNLSEDLVGKIVGLVCPACDASNLDSRSSR